MNNEEHELARADREFEERISLPPSPYVWVMDSECCAECGWLLGYFGECTNPACPIWEGWTGWDEEEDDPYADSGDYDERAYLMGEYDDENIRLGQT